MIGGTLTLVNSSFGSSSSICYFDPVFGKFGKYAQKMNIPIAAPNMRSVVRATTARETQELG
jgi:hypothetical protein